jgi:hypothetical protein
MVGQLVGWANSLDPTKDTATVVGNRQVYDNGTMQYSYNFLGMPYEVKVVDGKVVDANVYQVARTAMTGYERYGPRSPQHRGDNDTCRPDHGGSCRRTHQAQAATGTNMDNVTAATDRFSAISRGLWHGCKL